MPADWIRRYDRFDELDSTSSYLARLWRSGDLPSDETPIVVTARNQTAGRGRGDNRWYADRRSLTFTLGVRPADFGLGLEEIVPVGLMSACAAIESIEAMFPALFGHLGIRWPNDIECDAGKVGGILPECILRDENEILLLVGIGINVSTDLSAGPVDAQKIGVALADLVGPYEIQDDTAESLLERILVRFQGRLLRMGTPQDPWISEARRFDRLAGTSIQARQGHELIRGIARGWDDQGRLIVARESGGVALVSSGQILRN